MYSISSYGRMIADSIRTQAYASALRQAIKPDSVVLDIGTGIGIFAMLACQFGARRVFAIEPDDAIQVAREIAAANGFADRIEFIQDLSTRTILPEQADVIISDLRGVLPLFRHHIPSIADARKRFLASGGVLIPKRDTLWAAVAEAPNLYVRYTIPWNDNDYGLDLRTGQRIVINTWHKGRVNSDQLLTDHQQWGALDYNEIENPDVTAEITYIAMRAGVAHGLCLWFDAELAKGVSFSNAPDRHELIYGSAFLPLSAPVTMAVDDAISVTLSADLVGDDYIWRWNTQVLSQGDPRKVKADFKQSTFFGMPLSPERLHKQAATHVPALNEDGHIDQFIVSLIDGKTSLGQIAQQVSDNFPGYFARWQDALTRVSEISLKYSP